MKSIMKKTSALFLSICMLVSLSSPVSAQASATLPASAKKLALQVSEYASTELAQGHTKNQMTLTSKEKYDAVAVLAFSKKHNTTFSKRNLKQIYKTYFGTEKRYNFKKSQWLLTEKENFRYNGGEWGESIPANKIHKVRSTANGGYDITIKNCLRDLFEADDIYSIGSCTVHLAPTAAGNYIVTGIRYRGV